MTKQLLLLSVLAFAGCASQSGAMGTKEDEQAVRQWFDNWIESTTVGDLQLMRSLIADDAVFFVPSAGTMEKEGFAAAATATDANTDFDLDCSIEDLEIFGDRAWVTTRIELSMTDKRSGAKSKMAGYSLSVLRREGDGWVVIRDANTMVAVR